MTLERINCVYSRHTATTGLQKTWHCKFCEFTVTHRKDLSDARKTSGYAGFEMYAASTSSLAECNGVRTACWRPADVAWSLLGPTDVAWPLLGPTDIAWPLLGPTDVAWPLLGL